jgi:glycosyltransferase 2 family protein
VNGQPRGRGSAPRLVGIAVSAISLAAVVWWASRQPAPSFPSSPGELWALAGAVGVYAVATALRSERWLGLLRHDGAEASRTDCYALTLVGFMGNNVLPLRAGDVMRVYLMAPRARTTVRNVIGTLIAERLLDVVVLLGLFFILAYGVLRGIDTPSETALGAAAAVMLAGVVVAAVALPFARRTGRGRRVIDFLRPLATATRDLRGSHGAAMVAVTLSIWLAEGGCYLLVGRSVGLDMTPIQALYLIALASVFLLIPSGPGYVGTLDAAVVFGVRAIGGTGSEAVSYLLMLRFVLLVPITAAGLATLVLRYGGPGAWRSAQAQAVGP